MNCRLLVQVLAIGLCTAALSFRAGGQSQDQATDVIPLDPEVQQEINRVVTALSVGEMPEEAVQEIVQDFKGFKNKSPQELLLQVLAVYGGKDEYRSNPRAEMAKRLLLSNLLQEMTSLDIVAAVAPKYEQASDLKLQKSLRQALNMAVFKNGRVNPDFEAFLTYIAQNKEQPPMKLIGYMYGLSPHLVLQARVTLKPEALEVSPGILTAFVHLPEGYPVSGITSATCDGAPSERMMLNDDKTEMIIKFRREAIEAALARVGESIDTNFVVRGVWQSAAATNLFEGAASIKKIVGAKDKDKDKDKDKEKKK